VGGRRDDSITVWEYLDSWMAGRQSLGDSTRLSYGHQIKAYLRPHLGRIRVVNLRVQHIEVMDAAIRADGNLSLTSIRRVHATLRAALNAAVRQGLIAASPASHVELQPTTRHQITVWSAEQVRTFLAANQEDRLIALYQLLALRGLRRGEAVGLRWRDVALERSVLRVEQQLVEVGTELVLGAPKTKPGTRTVSLDATTVAASKTHKARQSADRLACGSLWVDTGLVFTREDGTVVRPGSVSAHFKRMIKAAGLPRIRLHDLRHTSASLGLEAGESLKEVSDRLGHSSIMITADVYGHVAPELAQRSAERLADLVAAPAALDGR
jgi:integrase